MFREIFIIGVGGQGAQSLGEILMIAARNKNYSASFYPFYGSQMRGGETGCIVKIDTDGNEILNPTINMPTDFLILDKKFFDKYKKFENEKSKYFEVVGINDKNLNLKLLKKFVNEESSENNLKLFKDEDIIEAIREKFKNSRGCESSIDYYNNS